MPGCSTGPLLSVLPELLTWNMLAHQYCPRDVGYPYACDRSMLESRSAALTQCSILSCPLHCASINSSSAYCVHAGALWKGIRLLETWTAA